MQTTPERSRPARPATPTPSAGNTSTPPARIVTGALAGLLAGALFVVAVPPAELMPMVASLYGFDGIVAGWLFHLLHSAGFGAAFSVVVSAPGITRAASRPLLGAALGALYGVAGWAVFASVVMPGWIGAVTDMSPPVPDWNAASFAAHLVFGIALGVLVPLLTVSGRAEPTGRS